MLNIGIKFSQITGLAHFHAGVPPFNKIVVFWSSALKLQELILKNDTLILLYGNICPKYRRPVFALETTPSNAQEEPLFRTTGIFR